MDSGRLSEIVLDIVAKEIELSEREDFKDIETIVTPDGREVGKFRAYKAQKIEKFSIAEFCLAPGMDYINASIRAYPEYNIPRFAFNYMVFPDKIQFDVDLYPAVDIALRQDYIDKYYELLTETYLREKKAPYFDWKLSERSWVRVSASPYFFMSATDIENAEKVKSIILEYLDVELKIIKEEEKVSQEEAVHIKFRSDYITDMLLEREPEKHLLEKAFGKELTERLGRAMV